MSFLHDSAAEMVYPLLPAFLTTPGATPVTLGMLEGFAEATVEKLAEPAADGLEALSQGLAFVPEDRPDLVVDGAGLFDFGVEVRAAGFCAHGSRGPRFLEFGGEVH